MTAAKPTAASGTGAPFCWPKVSKLGTPWTDTGTGWRSSTNPGGQVSAGLIDGRSEGGAFLRSNWHVVVQCSLEPAPG